MCVHQLKSKHRRHFLPLTTSRLIRSKEHSKSQTISSRLITDFPNLPKITLMSSSPAKVVDEQNLPKNYSAKLDMGNYGFMKEVTTIGWQIMDLLCNKWRFFSLTLVYEKLIINSSILILLLVMYHMAVGNFGGQQFCQKFIIIFVKTHTFSQFVKLKCFDEKWEKLFDFRQKET